MGLFDFLGGNKSKAPQSKEAYFLSEDEAKTFGDIDYMRKEVVIRRTFAKKKGQEEMESVKSISAGTARSVGESAQAAPTSFSAPTAFSAPAAAPVPTAPAPAAPTPAAPAPAPAEASTTAASELTPAPATESTPAPVPEQPPVTRTPDTSMDMFRNMAKNIRR